MLHEGDLLDGKYRILREIGHGGMSVVYLALNERANKTWAVKEVRKDGGNDQNVVSQGLVAETEMLKKLSHPNLPSIVDVIDTKESFIIVMDYIEGGSLQKKLSHEGAQNAEDVITWSMQLCDVLGYLHSRKPPIIYRDMKPSNVMLKPDGNVSLIDFGTAREYKQTSQGDTTWLGTRGYAAPEQFGGHGQTDARTDIYCLGATMYHLLTGYSPADTQFIIYPIGKFRPELAGSGIEKVVAKCCQPDPVNRYQSCSELMYALEHVHDEDDAIRKSRDRKWHIFLASCIVTIVGIVGMLAFHFLGNSALSQTYEGYLDQAKGETDIAEAKQYYKAAMDLDPDNYEAYEALLNAIIADNQITDEENQALKECLNSMTGSRNRDQTNISQLKANDPDHYYELEYLLGRDYYIGYRKGKKEAYTYLSNVTDGGEGHIDDQEYKYAETYKNLCEFYVTLINEDTEQVVSDTQGSGSGDDEAWANPDKKTIKDYWDALMEIGGSADTVAENAGGSVEALAIYREICTRVNNNLTSLIREGVSISEIISAVDTAEEYVNEQQVSTDNQSLINDCETAISLARGSITSYQQASVKNTVTQEQEVN